MNKNILTILATAALVLTTGCATAGTWVNGCYINGPLCTVCDGARVVTHAYGTTICAHCDGTGIEPPETTMVVQNVVVDTWCPPPPRCHHPRPIIHRPPPHHVGRPPQRAARRPPPRPAARPARPAARPARPAARPAGHGGRGGGGHGRR